MKRSLQAVLALVILAALGLAAAPSGAVAPPKAKAFVTTAAPATSVWSQSVKLTAAITPKGGGQPKGGTVTFLSDGVPVGTAIATTRNTTLTTSTLPPGEHVITAEYSGDAVTAPSTSTGTTTVTVNAAPTSLTLKVTQNPVPYEDRAEIKAVVTAVAPAVTTRRPTGTVTFSTDTCITATVALNSNGVATWRPWLCPGAHEVTATYDGSDRHAGGSTASTVVTVEDEGPGGDDQDVDQVNPGPPATFTTVLVNGVTSVRLAQTTTAGRTGQIYAVDLIATWVTENGTPPSDLLVTIQAVDETGHPAGAVLGYGTLSAADVEPDDPMSYHVDLEGPAGVDEGGTYAIVLELANPQTVEAFGVWIVALSAEDSYSAGELQEDVDDSGWSAYDEPGVDLMFRTHVGDPV